MEVDGDAEAVTISITARGFLEPLDDRVDAFEAGVGDPSLDRASARSRVSHIIIATSFKCQQRAVFDLP